MMTPRRRSTDEPDAAPENWRELMEQRITHAEQEAGVKLTPEWRAFFIALGNPEVDDQPRGELE